MAKQDTKIALLEQSMIQNTQEHKEIKQMICDLKADLKSFMEGADEKFASKLTEKIVYGLIGAVALSVLYFILKSVGIE